MLNDDRSPVVTKQRIVQLDKPAEPGWAGNRGTAGAQSPDDGKGKDTKNDRQEEFKHL